MEKNCQLSRNAQAYLREYNCILKNMIQGMTCARLGNSISYNFIVQMIPHHEAAIRMCHNLLKYTTSLPLQEICDQIICEQTRSIENMESIRCGCGNQQNSQSDLCRYQKQMDRIMQNMFSCMGNACSGNNINADFIHEMIPHHRGAIEMCENALQYCVCPGLIPIMKNIIASQSRGISQLEQALQCV